ncbi:molybdopterin-guanine dinucleotide biosynthesis protein B [Lederbergia panacisoli]|uniref:molybdopterin-guanine dinucleotide biosynthesis protein B n=1 Tax=Lederbergia panacisoli TaxID=1255251 RepID=UPI00214B5116|nr:molybdopterin-guanine dinucleotide biosynthesis protein B [Lederbergia panacisoli]MCR2820130.1 molybdopterin-guanine dinucleotide biosynthesis protein B [Lederbergia panacisoli]
MGGSKVFQIVGYQNSGKTTLMEELIKSGKAQGLRIGTIKHHGHGGSPNNPSINKDSIRHSQAGAEVSSVEGEGTLLIEASKSEWRLDDIINMYHHFTLHLILVEGYKKSHYPKVVLIRDEEDLVLLDSLTNIKAVISWIPIKTTKHVFLHKQLEDFIDFFYNDIFSDLDSCKNR